MIITDKFVYVHQPKTGGTFVTSVLFRLHGYRWSRYKHAKLAVFKRIEGGRRHGTIAMTHKHGTCSDIPAEDRGKPILATIRNPFDYYVSQYEFGWWRRRDFRKYYREIPDFERRFPSFPDLSFSEFVELMEAAFCRAREPDGSPRFGWATEDFARFYLRRPHQVLDELSDDDIESRRYEDDLFDVRFVRQNRLNEGLYEFLTDIGYPAEEVEFVKGSERVLPQGRGRADGRWQSYYTPELKAALRRRDRLLFHAFPDFDV